MDNQNLAELECHLEAGTDVATAFAALPADPVAREAELLAAQEELEYEVGLIHFPA